MMTMLLPYQSVIFTPNLSTTLKTIGVILNMGD